MSTRYVPDEDDFKDASGKYRNHLEDMVKTRHYHVGKGHIYQICDIIFDSERDRWMFAYRRVDEEGDVFGNTYAHLPEDFKKEGRFLPINK